MAKKKPQSSPVTVSQVDIDALQEKCLEVIRRDIAFKMAKVVEEPLDAKDARAIIDYTRLFSEIKGMQEDQAANLTDEQIAEMLDESRSSDPEERD